MKVVSAFFGIALLAGMFSPASAQIRNNEASIATLAVQCAVSSGFSPADYEEYCGRLAKTLSMLSSDQQSRVFGFLPQPAASSLGSSEIPGLGSNGTSTNLGSTTTDGGNTGLGTTTSGESGASQTQSSALVNFVGGLNNLLDGNVEVTTTVVAQSSGESFATANVSGDNGATDVTASSNTTGSGLSDFLAWLSAAGTAIRNGTLSDFLAGGSN